MMTFRTAGQWTALLLISLLAAACGSQKEPAQAAIDQVESSIAPLRDDAAKLAPDELKRLDDELAAMKDNFAKKDYASVLTAARELPKDISALSETIATKKTELDAQTQQLTERWNTLSTELAEMVETVSARVDLLAKSAKPPKGLDAAAFDAVKTSAATMKQSWQQALGAFSNGNMQEAVDMAQLAKNKAAEVMTKLGMSPTS